MLAHQASTGGLHAVAVLRSTITQTLPDTVLIEATFTAIGNYLITNGNGAPPLSGLRAANCETDLPWARGQRPHSAPRGRSV